MKIPAEAMEKVSAVFAAFGWSAEEYASLARWLGRRGQKPWRNYLSRYCLGSSRFLEAALTWPLKDVVRAIRCASKQAPRPGVGAIASKGD